MAPLFALVPHEISLGWVYVPPVLLVAVLFVVIGVGLYILRRTVSAEVTLARRRSDFVSAVSHELRTPLTGIAGMARVRWQRWFPIIFIGECIWTGSLVVVGYHLGEYIKQLELGMQIVAVIGFIVFIGIMLWLFKRVSKASQLDTA